jgi:MoaA/NifB/PqqE/SkfB family radical SAM enzyme
LYLDQKGDVRACCWNSQFPLGNVAESSLSDIWFGERANQLRAALAVGDYRTGCHACAQEVIRGNDDVVFARLFDHLEAPGADGLPTEIWFSMSNTCNLQCVMCRGEWSSSIRAQREGLPALPAVYDDRFFDELRGFLPPLRKANFLGGEPFLERETFRVWDLMIEMGSRTPCNVTTNGTQWNRRIERVLDSLPMSITVSIDAATARTYESIRVGADYGSVIENIRRFHSRAERNGTDFTLTFCLMSVNWFEFADHLLFAESLGCTTGVNLVPEPVEFDIERLPADELRDVVAEMERQEATRLQHLVLNRPVWDAHLTRLRHLLTAKEHGTDVWILRPYDGADGGPYLGQDMGPPGPKPVEGAPRIARALAEAWASVDDVAEITVDDQQRIVACDPIVAGRPATSWVGTDAWATIHDALGSDPTDWTLVDLDDDPPVLCLEGAIPPPTQPPRLVRAYTADDVIGPDGQLGYRVFLAHRS